MSNSKCYESLVTVPKESGLRAWALWHHPCVYGFPLVLVSQLGGSGWALHAQHSQMENTEDAAIQLGCMPHVQPWCAHIGCVLMCNVNRHIWHNTTSTKCACLREHMYSNYTSCKFNHWLLPTAKPRFNSFHDVLWTICKSQASYLHDEVFWCKMLNLWDALNLTSLNHISTTSLIHHCPYQIQLTLLIASSLHEFIDNIHNNILI